MATSNGSRHSFLTPLPSFLLSVRAVLQPHELSHDGFAIADHEDFERRALVEMMVARAEPRRGDHGVAEYVRRELDEAVVNDAQRFIKRERAACEQFLRGLKLAARRARLSRKIGEYGVVGLVCRHRVRVRR